MEVKELKHTRKGRRQLGQGMTEYIIIVALVAISAIGAFTFFGDTVRAQIAGMSQELSGQDAAAEIAEAAARANDATAQATADKGLATYNGNGGI